MAKTTIFQVRINGGRIRDLTVQTSSYIDAVAAVPAVFGVELPATAKIWCEDLLPEYGPYFYRAMIDECGEFVVAPMTRRNGRLVVVDRFVIPGEKARRTHCCKTKGDVSQ